MLAQLLEEKMGQTEEAQKLYRLGLINLVGKGSEGQRNIGQLKSERSQKPILKIIQ